MLKHQGDIPVRKRHNIELAMRTTAPTASVSAAVAPEESAPHTSGMPGLNEALVARVEAAAQRAEQAAVRAQEESEVALRAAERADRMVDEAAQRRSH